MPPLHNPPDRWGCISIALHWTTVLAIVGLAVVGLNMDELRNGPFKVQVYALHKSVGLTVLALTMLRLAWRVFAGAPRLLPMPRWQRIAAHMSHVALYALLFAMPLSGWLFNSAAGFPLRWFGWLRVPALTAYDASTKAFAHDLHEGLAKVLLAVVVIHVMAALKHHLVDRDATLHRMLPWVRAPAPGRIVAP